MKVAIGNVFDSDADVIGITTNAYVKRNGCLAMGRGAAAEAVERFPGIERRAGTAVRHLSKYGWLVVDQPRPDLHLAIFQTKYHWKDPADIGLIKYSAEQLNNWIRWERPGDIRKPIKVAINYPGIGMGQRTREQIEPYLSILPDEVLFYIIST